MVALVKNAKHVLLLFVDELTVSLAVEYLSIDDVTNEKPLKYRQGFKPRSLLVATGLDCPRTREPTKEERNFFYQHHFFLYQPNFFCCE